MSDRRGLMLVLSSPSGAGKSTIAHKLLDVERNLRPSISVTTRARRPSEVNEVDYYFIDGDRFAEMRAGGDMLEWALVHGNYYGTPRAPVIDALSRGRDVLFDIDWQGTRQLKAAMGNDVVGVFILPPSMQELRQRLFRRAEDDPEVIEQRVRNARSEIEHWTEYKYVLVNRDLQDSFDAARNILHAERDLRNRPGWPQAPELGVFPAADRFRRESQPGLASFVDELLASPV